MPVVLYLLGLAVFAQGTSEFMLSGLVVAIADDLAVSVPTAGLLTSAFAVGMVVGAPSMAVLSSRWSRRRALLFFLGTFTAVHVLGAMSAHFAVLLATRVVGALANAGFLAVALAATATLVPQRSRARATAVLLAGVTLACVVGVPAGAVLGQLWGWRAAFWAVAALALPALVAIAWAVPHQDPGASRPNVRAEWAASRNPDLVLTLLAGAFVNAATFATFTYLGPVATSATGLPAASVPAVLALFGAGSFVGVTVAGRIADARPAVVLLGGGPLLIVGWAVFAMVASQPAITLALVFVQGALSFAVGSTLIARALSVAPGAPTLGGGLATAALNVGAAAGPWLGGVALAGGGDARSPLWASAALAALGVLFTATALWRGAARSGVPHAALTRARGSWSERSRRR
ncbi:MFS transporter [Saccharomonospora piscinae]|uniref:Cmx/CmrA family chloramphenicol efflux MFS transporter n=1 Tax=Saccharomonospora piscinae TaxID=687388 RepID=UPI00110616FB|nr:Cmx/CmrA family chloramphenicol efflux MFS transporter [Saccharomonospora piscinae]TLW91194.1 MFS transporter [Saccharomonospora piscinae]